MIGLDTPVLSSLVEQFGTEADGMGVVLKRLFGAALRRTGHYRPEREILELRG